MKWRSSVLALAAFLACSAPIALAHADAKDDFFKGTDLEAAGQYAEAARVYQSIADGAPQDRFADDALNALARLYEEKLGDPAAALVAYERLLRDYPQSNLAIRAGKRAELLRRGMGPEQSSAGALAAYNDVLQRFVDRPRAESIARMETLVAEHPDFPLAPEAVYWIGTMYRQDGRRDEALVRFREVLERWPRSDVEPRARKAIGDVLVERREFDAGEAQYRLLMGRGDAALDAVGREALDRARLERWRWRAYLVSWLIALLFPIGMVVAARRAAGGWREAGKALSRPPVEVWYLVPVVLLFVAAGMTENAALGHAIHLIAAGALIVTWLSGATLEAARARGPISVKRVLGHVAAAAAAVLAVCYIAVTRERLVDMLIETVRFGAERH
jgi:tetratricopeptide (TPR) repeat protein